MQSIQADRLVVFKELRQIFGIPYSRFHLWRLEKEKKFPRRIPLSTNRTCWRASEVQAWIDELAARRDGVTLTGERK